MIFLDFETRSTVDLPKEGAYRYARHESTRVLCFGIAFGYETPRAYRTLTREVRERLRERLLAGDPVVAHNAMFDRLIWEHVWYREHGLDCPPLDQWICTQTLARANVHPPRLAALGPALGLEERKLKDSRGAMLIKQLSDGNVPLPPEPRFSELMDAMMAYCAQDLVPMQEAFKMLRPMSRDDWHDYAVSEAINDRGVCVDLELIKNAVRYAEAESVSINKELQDMTEDRKITKHHHVRKAKWCAELLRPHDTEAFNLLVSARDDDGRATKFSLDQSRQRKLTKYLEESGDELPSDVVLEAQKFLELVRAGNSTTVNKFIAAADRVCEDGRLRGQYLLNGAGQTGRYSSIGVQLHNLLRAQFEDELRDELINGLAAGLPPQALEELAGMRLHEALARLIRPVFVAAPGHLLVWGDWSGVEACGLPWLAGRSRGAEERIAKIEAGVDLYVDYAAKIFRKDPEDITKAERAIGKVAELACGYGGGVGSFRTMGRDYGVIVSEEKAQEYVSLWREINPWALKFWYALKDAALEAYGSPGVWRSAGRVRFMFSRALTGGQLICQLPCGRLIGYPHFRTVIEDHPEWGKRKNMVFKRYKDGVFGTQKIWHGLLAENVTQAVCGSLLRGALSRAEAHPMLSVVLHTHDEVVVEAPEADAHAHEAALRGVMLRLPEWARGFPLSVAMDRGRRYKKSD